MSADDLLLFATVAQAGSFTAAATRLDVPKSRLSRRLAALERALGERLLLRTTRRLVVTEFGQLLLDHARRMAVELDSARELASGRQQQPSGHLRVSAPGDFAQLFLTAMLAEFMAACPQVTLELDLSPRRVDLLGERIDLAIRIGPLPDDSVLVARRLATLAFGLYAAPGYLARQGVPATPEALEHHTAIRLLRSDGQEAPWVLTQGDRTHHCGHAGRIAANSAGLLIQLACAGAGIAAVPARVAEHGLQGGSLVRILTEWALPAETVWAVYPGGRLAPAKTRAFLDHLQGGLGARLD